MTYRFDPPIINQRFCLQNNGGLAPKDRPYYFLQPWKGQGTGSYIILDDKIHQWFLDNNIFYELSHTTIHEVDDYNAYGYHIEIADKDAAMLYKLTWV